MSSKIVIIGVGCASSRLPGPCRDRCHPQVVSSGNGAVSPVPTTVETHGTRSQRHQTKARNR